MPSIKEWQHGAVVQCDYELGCIPTGIEWMIRVSGVEGVSLENFQEKYNLQKSGIAPNSFDNNAKAVNQDYPQVHIKFRTFIHGEEKTLSFLICLRMGHRAFFHWLCHQRGMAYYARD